MPFGIPNPINAAKDIIDKIEPNIPTASGKMPLGKFVWESIKGTPAGAKWFVFGGKPPFDTGEDEPFLAQIKSAKTKEQAQAVIDTYAGGEPLASDNMLKTLRDKGLLSRVYPGLANPGPGLSLDPNSDTGTAYLRIGAMSDVRGMDPYNVYDTLLQDAFSGNANLQLAYMRETDPLGVLPTLEQAISENTEKSHNSIKDRLGRLLGGGGKSLLNVFMMFERVEELMGQSYYYNKVSDPAMRYQMSKKFYNLALNPWDSNRTQQQHALTAIKEIEAQGLTGGKASAALDIYFKAHPLGLTNMFADVIDSIVLDPLWFVPIDKLVSTPIKATTGAPSATRIFRFLAPGAREAKATLALEVGGEFGWKQVFKLDNAAWAAAKWTSAPKGVTRILTTQLPHLGGEEASRQMIFHTTPVAKQLFENPENIMDLVQSIIQGKSIGFVEKNLPHLLENPAMAQLHAVSKGNEEFLTAFTKGLGKTWEAGEETVVNHYDTLIAKGGEEGAKAAEEKLLFMTSQLGSAASQTADGALRKLYNSTKLGRFILQKHSPFVTALKWPVMFVTINNPGFIYLNLIANMARHMWQAGPHPIAGMETYTKSLFYEFGRRGVSAADHPFANLYRAFGIEPVIQELTVGRNAALEQLMAHGGVNVAEDMTGKEFMNLLMRQARQPMKDILQQPTMKRRLLDILFTPTYLAGKMDVATRRATFALSLKEQLHWGSTASWIKNAGIFPIADWAEKRGMATKDARLLEDMVVDNIHTTMRKGENLTEEKLNGILSEAWGHFEQGTEGKLYSVRNTAREFAESKGYSPEEAIVFTQDIADFNATIYDNVMVDGLGKLVRGDITPKQFKNILDAYVLDYYTVHDQITAMGNVPSFWRTENTYQDALRMNERLMRDDMADVVNHLERHNNALSALSSDLKLKKREFHRLVGLNTVKNTEDLAAINKFAREATKAEGELTTEARGTLAQMYKDYFYNKLERHNLLYEFESAETGKLSLDHVETIINPWHESTLNTFKEHQKLITKALSQNTDEAWKAAAQRIKKMYEELATQRGQLFGHGVNDLPSAAKIMDASGPQAALIDEYATYLYNDLRKNIPGWRKAIPLTTEDIENTIEGLGKKAVLAGGAKATLAQMYDVAHALGLDDVIGYMEQYHNAGFLPIAKRVPGTGVTTKSAVQGLMNSPDRERLRSFTRYFLDKAYPDQDTIKLYRGWPTLSYGEKGKIGAKGISWSDRKEIADEFARMYPSLGKGKVVSKEVPKDDILISYHSLADEPGLIEHEYFVIPKEESARGEALNALVESKTALIPSELPGVAKEAYSHWSGAREQMLSNAMAKTDFVMLNYNQQYGLDRVFQAFIPFIFWPSRDSINWLIRVARQPGAGAGLLAAMQAPKEYAEQYGYPQRLQYQIPIPMPGLDEMLHDLPIVRNLLADVNFGPVYWVDPIRFITPMADYRQSYSNEKKRGTPMGLAADWLENYTPFSVNPFMKILGTETGLLDSDAWASTQFNGGPFGIPLTLTAQMADRWLRGGDLDAIPESEQYSYVNKGHFSVPFLNKALGLEPDAGDIYRAERSAWGLALQDKLLPGKPHEEQVRAALEAVDTHKGVAWERSLRSSTEEAQLRQITAWIGFPFGGVTGVNEGEYVWMSLQQAYSAYAEKGQLDKFFEKYPEFEVRSAVVKGMDSPEEKQIAIDNELYHQDVERLINKPYEASIEEIEGRLDQLAHLTQSTDVREQRQILLDELSDIRAQQSNMYDMLDKMYPKHIQELSLNHPPRERALMEVRDAWQAIRQQPDESWEEFRQRQEDFLSQFPTEEKGWGLQDWQDSYQAYLLTQIDYNLRTRKAADTGKWDDFDAIKQQREDRLTALHEQSMDGKLSRRAVESYLASWNYPKSPEQVEFDKAKSMMDMWMGLVGDGSMLTSREKGAVSDYFRAQPLIQKHYPLEVIPFENLTLDQRVDLMRRDEIWSTYYSMSTSENRLDYIRSVSDELNAINKRFGFPPLNVIDYEAPPPELGMGDPTIARLEMMAAAARRKALEDQGAEQGLDEATIKSYEELLAVDPNDPSPLTSQGLDWHLRQFVDPNQQ